MCELEEVGDVFPKSSMRVVAMWKALPDSRLHRRASNGVVGTSASWPSSRPRHLLSGESTVKRNDRTAQRAAVRSDEHQQELRDLMNVGQVTQQRTAGKPYSFV